MLILDEVINVTKASSTRDQVGLTGSSRDCVSSCLSICLSLSHLWNPVSRSTKHCTQLAQLVTPASITKQIIDNYSHHTNELIDFICTHFTFKPLFLLSVSVSCSYLIRSLWCCSHCSLIMIKYFPYNHEC